MIELQDDFKKKVKIFLPYMAVGAFFFLLLFGYPGFSFCCPYWNFHVLSNGSFVLFELAILLLFPERIAGYFKAAPRAIWISLAVIILLSIYQIIVHLFPASYTPTDCGWTLFLPVTILFAGSFHKEIKNILPYFLTFVWCTNSGLCLLQINYYHTFCFGIPGNINWNAALILSTLPFVILIIRKYSKGAACIVLSVAAILLSLYFVRLTESKGMILASLLMGAVAVFMKYRQKYGKLILGAGLLILIAASGFFALNYKKAVEYLAEDERVYLLYTTTDMILHRPVTGYGAPSFEQEYSAFRTPEFYSRRHCSHRTNHPHNHFLYVAVSIGLIGLAAWLTIIFRTLRPTFRKYDELDLQTKLILLICSALLIHAQLDLVLYAWPVNFIGVIMLGLLTVTAWEKLPEPIAVPNSSWLSCFSLWLFFLGFSAGINNLMSGIDMRKSDIAARSGNLNDAVKYAKSAAQRQPEHLLYAYNAAFFFLNHSMNQDVLDSLEYMQRSAIPDLALIHQFRAQALTNLKRYDEAEQELLREIELHPVMVVPLMKLADLYQIQGKSKQSMAVRLRLAEVMTYRKLLPDDLKRIWAEPDLDLYRYLPPVKTEQ